MEGDDVARAYGANAEALADMLGTVVDPRDPDRAVIEAWARTVDGRVLDVGAGTGRWTGHLAGLGYDVVGLEPAAEFVEIARRTHPAVEFRQAGTADLAGSAERWAGVLAWYSLIHLGPAELARALSVLRGVLVDGGSILASFFTGPHAEAMNHPVATAYRMPMAEMSRALAGAGFEVADQQWHPGGLHAHVTARAITR